MGEMRNQIGKVKRKPKCDLAQSASAMNFGMLILDLTTWGKKTLVR